MSGISDWKEAQKKLQDARDYLALIGKTTTQSTLASREGESATRGRLTKVSVETQVHFQPYDGATNYHRSAHFDQALSAVISANWSSLRDQTLAHLESEVQATARKAKAELEAQLAEITPPACVVAQIGGK